MADGYTPGMDYICEGKGPRHPRIHHGPDAGQPYDPSKVSTGIYKGGGGDITGQFYNGNPVGHTPCAYHRRQFVASAYKGHKENERRRKQLEDEGGTA